MEASPIIFINKAILYEVMIMTVKKMKTLELCYLQKWHLNKKI